MRHKNVMLQMIDNFLGSILLISLSKILPIKMILSALFVFKLKLENQNELKPATLMTIDHRNIKNF